MKNQSNYIAASILILALLGAVGTESLMQLQASETTDNNTASNEELAPRAVHEKTTRDIVRLLESRHYLDLEINNELSHKILDKYLESLDPSKAHFLKSDVNSFASFRDTFDSALKQGKLENAFKIYNRYHERRSQRLSYTEEILEQGFDTIDLNEDEWLILDREDEPWLTNEKQAKALWKRLIKNDVLNLKLADTSDEEIMATLKKRLENQQRFLAQTKSDDVFEFFMSAYTHLYDPHTDYFAPEESENFDIHMSLSLQGIGALLQREDEYIKVVRLIKGGPADLGKQLQPADRIVAVAQGEDGELVNVEGWRLDDVVQKIRGPQGSVVRLRVIPADNVDISKTRVISITRDIVKLEDQSAQKKLIEITRDDSRYTVGVIELPTFYADYEAISKREPDARSSAADVEKLIHELLADNVDAMIIDLRNNGGGFLSEANQLTGLFIRTGPVVQVKGEDNQIEMYSDVNPKLAYTGPLAVLVNRLSASASEIFAGAIQDHGRGLVIGGQTFGKGTVQTIYPLNSGRLKYTQSKYYRINGESTQLRGVIPDITYPSVIDHQDIGESALPEAMAWDKIPSARYRSLVNMKPIVSYLNSNHKRRVKNNPDFRYLTERAEYLEENRKKKRTPLNEKKRRQERKQAEQRLLDMENERRKAKNMELLPDYAALENSQEVDDDSQPSDSLLDETGHILIDWIEQQELKVALQ